MKNLVVEIRKFVASELLNLSLNIIPEGEFKLKYSEFLSENIMKL